jgi:two-component sensor histidine kinase
MAAPDSFERQRRALAEFGIFALRATDIDAVLAEACRRAAEGLGIEMAKILELRPAENCLLVISGHGLLAGTVGHARVPLGKGSAAGWALESGQPVISPDTATETRFQISETVRQHAVRSMANVLISYSDGTPFGVLELDSHRPGMFGMIDSAYLQSYANLVGAALERARSRRALQQALEERDIFMRELQHRVRNDLQAVIGLLVVEAADSDNIEARHRLERVRSRVNALRLVHDRLFRDQRIGRVDALSYLGDLARSCIEVWSAAHGQTVELRLEGASREISHDTAVTLGLIVNEFITNSVRHAFPFGRGTIALDLRAEDEGRLCLCLADNGIGMPSQTSRHSGRRFIEALVRQLGAEAEWSGEGGTRLILRFSASG